MGAGNFDSLLEIDEEGHILPSGPLEVPGDATFTKLYAWVFQLKGDGSGAMCAAAQEGAGFAGLAPGPSIWMAKAGPIHEGRFVPGPAVAMAVLVSRRHGEDKTGVYWWSENIDLVARPQKP